MNDQQAKDTSLRILVRDTGLECDRYLYGSGWWQGCIYGLDELGDERCGSRNDTRRIQVSLPNGIFFKVPLFTCVHCRSKLQPGTWRFAE